jgi:hypothetical protein
VKGGKISPIRESKLDPLLKSPYEPPSNALFGNEDEHSYFQVFQERTATSLSGYFYSGACNQLSPQPSHREAFIPHAVVGIGALNKTPQAAGCYSARDLEYIGRRDGHVHHEFALEQGSKALRLMRNAAGSGMAFLSGITSFHVLSRFVGILLLFPSLGVAIFIAQFNVPRRFNNCDIGLELLSQHKVPTGLWKFGHSLFTGFESFHGNQNSPLDQAQIGVNLLLHWQQQMKARKKTLIGRGRHISGIQLEEDLIRIFQRIDK